MGNKTSIKRPQPPCGGPNERAISVTTINNNNNNNNEYLYRITLQCKSTVIKGVLS